MYDPNSLDMLLNNLNSEEDYSYLKDLFNSNAQPVQPGVEPVIEQQQPGLLGEVPQAKVEQVQPSNNAEQALSSMQAKADNTANNMLAQTQEQTQQAMQSSQALQQQRDADMANTEQQAAQALKQQQQEEAQRTAGLFKLATMIYGAAGGGAADASGVTDTAMEQTTGNSAFMSGGDLATGMGHLNNASGDWLTKAMNPGGAVKQFDFTKGLNKRFL